MTQNTYFISGATGSTGGSTARILTTEGHHVRTLARREDGRSAALRADGIEVSIGDLHDLDALRQAMDGVTGAYLVYPVADGLVEATALFAQAATESGVDSVVNMSQMPARGDAVSHATRQHWVSEQLLNRSGLNVTHLRPTLFTDWLLWAANGSGVIRLPFTNRGHAPVSAEEIAWAVAAILQNSTAHAGRTYTLTGDTETTFSEAVDEVSQAIGADLRFEEITIEQFADVARSIGGEYLLQHFTEISKDYARGVFSGTSSIIQDLTGKPALGVAEWSRHNAEAFARQLSSHG